jgi:hypothetical protein
LCPTTSPCRQRRPDVRHAASAGGTKSATASWYRRSQAPTCSSASSECTHTGHGRATPIVAPGRNVKISRPCPSTPRTRGAPSNRRASRCPNNACTAGVHGPVRRRTVPPTSNAPPALPPGSRCSSTPISLPDITGSRMHGHRSSTDRSVCGIVRHGQIGDCARSTRLGGAPNGQWGSDGMPLRTTKWRYQG